MLRHSYDLTNKKDKTLRAKYLRSESFIVAVKICADCKLLLAKKTKRFLAFSKQSALPLIKNRFLFTSNCNSVMYRLKVSRHKFRSAVVIGYLVGVFKM